MMTNNGAVSILLLLLFATSSAFSGAAFVSHPKNSFSRPKIAAEALRMAKADGGEGSTAVGSVSAIVDRSLGRDEFILRAFSAASLATAIDFGSGPSPASAEAVRVFDMSLPSYEQASKPTAGASAVESIDPYSTEGKLGITRGTTGGGKGGGGNPLASLSGRGGGGKKEKAKKEKMETARKEREDKEEKKKEEQIKIMDMGMPSYGSEVKSKEKSIFQL